MNESNDDYGVFGFLSDSEELEKSLNSCEDGKEEVLDGGNEKGAKLDQKSDTSEIGHSSKEKQDATAMYSTLVPLIQDICHLMTTPQQFTALRDYLVQTKEQLVRGQHYLTETTDLWKNGKLKPRKKRKRCPFCTLEPDPKPKSFQTFRHCAACGVAVCPDPNCLRKHWDQLLMPYNLKTENNINQRKKAKNERTSSSSQTYNMDSTTKI